MITYHPNAKDSMGNGLNAYINTGSQYSSAYIEIRSAPRPASVTDTAGGLLLAVLTMSNPAFNDFANGSSLSRVISPDSSVNTSGIASWFRLYNCNGEAVLDGSVTAQGNGGDLELENIDLEEGAYLAISYIQLKPRLGV